MKLEFLGTGCCLPEYEQADTATLLINRSVLVDTGWHVVRNLMRTGLMPNEVTHLFFTHMHQDHYMGLAALLFYMQNGYQSYGKLKIFGPERVCEVAEMAMHYNGCDRYFGTVGRPEVIQLPEQGSVDVDGLHVDFIPSHHAVPGRCYRFTDAQTGKAFTYSGDTKRFAELDAFAAGSEVLIHEASFGAGPTPDVNPACHSSAMDAAVCAKNAGVKHLYLVHAREASLESALQAARDIFPNTSHPLEHDMIDI